MKLLQTFLLLLALCIATCGTYISFYIQQYSIQSEIRAAIKAQKRLKTEVFRFTEKEFRELKKYEGEREFSLHGIIYDVVKKTDIKGMVVLHAYADHEETSLFEKFRHYFEQESDASKNAKRVKTSFFLSEYDTPAIVKIFHPELETCSIAPVNCFLHYGYTLLSSPPPDFRA